MSEPTAGWITDSVRTSYDERADDYARSRTMQSGNLDRLARLLAEEARNRRIHRLLDLGCGAGHGLDQLPDLLGTTPCAVGIDLSEQLLVRAAARHREHAFVAADAADLPLADRSIDLVVSNSVLHWLNAPEHGRTPAPALAEVHRVLTPGGLLIASIAGVGTARRFQRSYAAVIDDLRRQGLVDDRRFRPDPIGSMALHDVIDLAQAAGLEVRRAWLAYEPVAYERAEDYAADVAAYGFGPYTAAVAAEHRAEAFASVTERFVADHGPGPYLHDQHMIYLSAQRPT
jgi:ubiquinone/menaquinone biosynthesis C-methylase UbiE